MKAKKVILALVIAVACVLMTGCKYTEEVSINFGEDYSITNEKLSKYDNIVWTSENEDVAGVDGNVVSGVGPGTTTIIGASGEKVVAEYIFTVNVVPITGIVLSTNSTTITVDDGFQLNYSLFPDNASDYGIRWKSADENVAIVNDSGFVLGKQVGQTTISASNENGIMATCSVTVEEKAAYDRLTDEERAFVDVFLEGLSYFYNPDSVTVKAIEKDKTSDDDYMVEISAQNRLGGYNTVGYFVNKIGD